MKKILTLNTVQLEKGMWTKKRTALEVTKTSPLLQANSNRRSSVVPSRIENAEESTSGKRL